MSAETLKNVMQFIHTHQNFMVCSHIHPDGDALGTTLGLGLALKEMGKKVTLYNAGPIAYNLKFLPGIEQVVHAFPDFEKPLDGTIIVDCGSIKRIGPDFKTFMESGNTGTMICVDHHASNTGFGGLDLIEPTESSSGEVAAKIIQGFRHPFSPEVATNLFCALTTDTGGFRYESTTDHTLRLAAQLVEAGAKPSVISENLFERKPKYYFHILRDVLDTLEFHPKHPMAWVTVKQDTLKKYDYDIDVLEGVIEEVRSLDFCEVAIFFKEDSEGIGYKLSTRSKNYINVSKICVDLGGGGHHRASGVSMKGTYEEIKKKVIQVFEKEFELTSGK
jgi:bifunctional oligoribonuclease and PAP phosphatase NrnA